jgi:hypothetical protein
MEAQTVQDEGVKVVIPPKIVRKQSPQFAAGQHPNSQTQKHAQDQYDHRFRAPRFF